MLLDNIWTSPSSFFIKGCPETVRIVIKDELDVQRETLNEKYLMGSLHRKQKNFLRNKRNNPKDLDLLDEDSEGEIQSLTLEDRTNAFCRCRGWLVDPRN